jgi:hypothetical protein
MHDVELTADQLRGRFVLTRLDRLLKGDDVRPQLAKTISKQSAAAGPVFA